MSTSQLHFVMIPLMGQGHLIPSADIAKLLAQQGIIVTILTTPVNAARIHTSIDLAIKTGLSIAVSVLQFPATDAGLPAGCESLDLVPSRNFHKNFVEACSMLQQPVELLLEGMQQRPSCIIADRNLPWTADVASKLRIPLVSFDGTSCSKLLCCHILQVSKVHESFPDGEPFVVPGLPDRIELTRAQLPGSLNRGANSDFKDFDQKRTAYDEKAIGVLINSFEELEIEYVKEYKKAKGDGHKVWCIGPVSLSNTKDLDKAERGNKASIDENQCLNWLDSQAPGSVIYACFGSLSRITAPQMIELGLALEASERPFIWVIRGGYNMEELEKWIVESGFQERIKKRGLLIRGWAPQMLILSHSSIGGFLTHCGWNSTLEGISAGVPMITWPLFADQFLNEKLIAQVLDIGVGVGAEMVVQFGEEEKFGVLVKREKIRKAINRVMCEGQEGEERRERARKFAEMAKKAVENGGSSYLNVGLFIEDIKLTKNICRMNSGSA